MHTLNLAELRVKSLVKSHILEPGEHLYYISFPDGCFKNFPPYKTLQSSIELSFDFYDYVTDEWEPGRGTGDGIWVRVWVPVGMGYNLFLLRLLICMRLTCALPCRLLMQ